MMTILALAINLIFIALFFLYLTSAKVIAVFIGVSLIAWFFYFLWKRQNFVEQRIKEKIADQTIVKPLERVFFVLKSPMVTLKPAAWGMWCLPNRRFILNWCYSIGHWLSLVQKLLMSIRFTDCLVYRQVV